MGRPMASRAPPLSDRMPPAFGQPTACNSANVMYVLTGLEAACYTTILSATNVGSKGVALRDLRGS
jgi:hypothetical protein